MRRRFALALLGLAAAALVAALPAAGKEGVKATLLTDIPLAAPTGTHVKVAWTLSYLGENGGRRPFGAGGVFVRFVSASGAPPQTAFAPAAAGEYAATVVVPKGGIGRIEIGLRGWASGPTGTREADVMFPITNDPLARRGSAAWIGVLVGSLMFALAVVALAVVRRRNAHAERAVLSSSP